MRDDYWGEKSERAPKKFGNLGFKVSLAATSGVFFWLLVSLALMIAGLFGTMNYSFGLVFFVLGILSSAGYISALNELKKSTRFWYLGLPLALTLITGTTCAFYATAMAGPAFPSDGPGFFVMNAGIAALMSLAPSACPLFIVLLQRKKEPELIKAAIGVSAVVSLLSIAMLMDMSFTALHFYQQAVFGHPYGEGFLILYGIVGTPSSGIFLLIIAFRNRDGAD